MSKGVFPFQLLLIAWVLASALVSRAEGQTGTREGETRETLVARAVTLIREGKGEEAASIYAKLLAEDPSDTSARVGRTRALLAAGKWPDALSEARHLSASAAPSSEERTALAEALYRSGDLDGASAEAAKAVAADPPPARALMVLGLVRVAEGKEDEGTGLLDRALAADPKDRDILFRAAGGAATRAATIEVLERYLAASTGDDPDRIDSAHGTIRTYRALGERPVWIRASRPESVEIPLHALVAGLGHASGYTVDAVLGEGKPVRLLLDSGASGLFLVGRIARKHGFAPLAEETAFGGGGTARHGITSGLISSIALGGLRFTDALASVTESEIEPTGRYAGILGLDTLRGYRITLDLDGERLLLEPPAASMQGDPYWVVGGQILVRAGAAGRDPALFMLDTGASASLLSLPFAESLLGAELGAPASVRGFAGALAGSRSVRGVRLRFQGLETGRAPLTASDLTLRSRLGGVEVSGYLGLDVYDQMIVVLDPLAHRVAVVRPRKK